MKPKDIVTIYEDPFTETKPEGKATLIRKLDVTNPGLEYWEVEFLRDTDEIRRRFIKAKTPV